MTVSNGPLNRPSQLLLWHSFNTNSEFGDLCIEWLFCHGHKSFILTGESSVAGPAKFWRSHIFQHAAVRSVCWLEGTAQTKQLNNMNWAILKPNHTCSSIRVQRTLKKGDLKIWYLSLMRYFGAECPALFEASSSSCDNCHAEHDQLEHFHVAQRISTAQW